MAIGPSNPSGSRDPVLSTRLLVTIVALFTWGVSTAQADSARNNTPEDQQRQVHLILDDETRAAWSRIQIADERISALIESAQIDGVIQQADAIKAATIILSNKIVPSDSSMQRRRDSIARQIIGFAERLHAAALSGKRTRVETAFHNLHRYVMAAREYLPPTQISQNTGLEDKIICRTKGRPLPR
jgi:hypothetical protein